VNLEEVGKAVVVGIDLAGDGCAGNCEQQEHDTTDTLHGSLVRLTGTTRNGTPGRKSYAATAGHFQRI
jgi:hypothetical protein